MLQAIDSQLPADKTASIVYLARLSEGSRRSTAQALDVMASNMGAISVDQFAWHQLRYQHTSALRSWLIEKYKPATVNRMLSALRGVLKEAWKLGQISAEDYRKAASIESVKNDVLPTGRELSAGEISALMQACKKGATAKRDSALMAVLYTCGLRRAEAVGLNFEDWDPDNQSLKIRGKGNKERLAFLTNGALRAMQDWITQRGNAEGALFLPISKGGQMQSRRLSTQAIYKMLARRGNQAGISSFSPHDLRRTFISHLLDAGADISVISKLAGHADVSTTARYDRRSDEAKRKAVELLHLPY